MTLGKYGPPGALKVPDRKITLHYLIGTEGRQVLRRIGCEYLLRVMDAD